MVGGSYGERSGGIRKQEQKIVDLKIETNLLSSKSDYVMILAFLRVPLLPRHMFSRRS